MRGYFTTQRKREECLSPALPDRSQCLQATSGFAQHHNYRQVPAELSVLLVLTQTAPDCAQRQSPGVRNRHTRSEHGIDLTNSSDNSYPWSTFQVSQESTTARLDGLQEVGSDDCKSPSCHPTRLSPACLQKTHGSPQPSAGDRQQKNLRQTLH